MMCAAWQAPGRAGDAGAPCLQETVPMLQTATAMLNPAAPPLAGASSYGDEARAAPCEATYMPSARVGRDRQDASGAASEQVWPGTDSESHTARDAALHASWPHRSDQSASNYAQRSAPASASEPYRLEAEGARRSSHRRSRDASGRSGAGASALANRSLPANADQTFRPRASSRARQARPVPFAAPHLPAATSSAQAHAVVQMAAAERTSVTRNTPPVVTGGGDSKSLVAPAARNISDETLSAFRLQRREGQSAAPPAAQAPASGGSFRSLASADSRRGPGR